MVAIAQAGLLGFAPVYQMGDYADAYPWNYHKAMDVDLAAVDDQRIGPPEIGGRPVPTLPYKAGVNVGGGFTINPRLQDTIGWLLYGALGYKASSEKAVEDERVLAKVSILEAPGAAHVINTGITAPVTPAKLVVFLHQTDDVTYAPTITVVGTDQADAAANETFNFDTGPAAGQRAVGIRKYAAIVSSTQYKTITSVSVGTRTPAGHKAYVSVGLEDAVAKTHVFTMDPNDPGLVKWMCFRKYVPKGDDTSLSYGEEYQDAKVMGFAMNLPNDGLISARVDTMARMFGMFDDPFNPSTGVWNHGLPTTEDYPSVPIGCNLGGYIKIPFFSDEPFNVINANVNWVNTPLDPRQLRVYGSPWVQDIVVVGRAFTFDLTVLWKNPELYKAIYGNSKTATAWSSIPFTSRVDLMTQSPAVMAGSRLPYSLRMEATKCNLAIQGGIRLAGNQAVLMRITGSALDTTADYARYSLTNLVADYAWPDDDNPSASSSLSPSPSGG